MTSTVVKTIWGASSPQYLQMGAWDGMLSPTRSSPRKQLGKGLQNKKPSEHAENDSHHKERIVPSAEHEGAVHDWPKAKTGENQERSDSRESDADKKEDDWMLIPETGQRFKDIDHSKRFAV